MSKVIVVTGSSSIESRKIIFKMLNSIKEKVNPTKIITGGDKKGVDSIIEEWGEVNDVEIDTCPIDWKDTSAEGAEVIEGPYGPYNRKAPLARNRKFIDMGHDIYCIWDGEEIGAKILFEYATNRGLNVNVVVVKGEHTEKHKVEIDPKYAKKDSGGNNAPAKSAPTEDTASGDDWDDDII